MKQIFGPGLFSNHKRTDPTCVLMLQNVVFMVNRDTDNGSGKMVTEFPARKAISQSPDSSSSSGRLE